MPVGPSHNRGSSRSSSSSGRSHSSSSRSYSSSSSRSHSSYSSSYTYYGGSGASISISPRGWARFGIVVGFIATLIMAIIGFAKLVNNIPYHYLMRKDAKEYLEIIDKANRGEAGYYIKEITGIRGSGSSTVGGNPTEYRLSSEGEDSGWYDNTSISAYCEVTKGGVNYYWFDITFYSEELDERISGITYSYYSEAQVSGLSSLNLVYTKAYDGDGSWDIIQQDYSLKKNIDYWYAGNQIFKGVLLIVLAGGLGTLMVWCCILLHRKGKNKEEKAEDKQIQDISDKFKECTYCGAQYPLDKESCSACGSKKFKKIKSSTKN